MADRKNQHFVPRALLKEWTLNGENKAINLYNIAADRAVQKAPVKNQCSRDYFYGADLKIETWLGHGEGIFARVVSELPHNDISDTAAALEILRDFSYLQRIRTERTINEELKLLREMYDRVLEGFAPEDEAVPDHEQIVREAIGRWRETSKALLDLKGVLVINDTNIPFVISDDPAIHTNRLHIHRLDSANFGIGQSGMILTMPVTPNLAVLYYDGAVYTVPSKVGLNVTIKNDGDANALNALQFLSANENVYYRDASEIGSIRIGCNSVANRRLKVHYALNILVPTEDDPNKFVRAEIGNDRPPGRSMVHFESVAPRPLLWPTFLRYRSDASGFSDGSAAGYVRADQAKLHGLTAAHKIRF